jgi:hypothetical protein
MAPVTVSTRGRRCGSAGSVPLALPSGIRLLQKLRESVIYGEPRGSIEAEESMGEVIQGPWRQREGPDQMRALSDEITRMTGALERLRELHKRGEALDLQADLDAGRK